MNQPSQPARSQDDSAEQSQPLPADTDPYYSIALNMPSGPVGSRSMSPPPTELGPTDSPAPEGLDDLQSGIDVLSEIDIRIYQLEDPTTADSDVPMPIRNACCLESPEVPCSSPVSAPCGNELPASQQQPTLVCQNEAGQFIASQNSVIYVDGNEGFDYIDLSDRDVACVTFGDSSMVVVDAETNESFTIEFQNISHALFANGKMIELS